MCLNSQPITPSGGSEMDAGSLKIIHQWPQKPSGVCECAAASRHRLEGDQRNAIWKKFWKTALASRWGGTSRYSAGESAWAGDTVAMQKCRRKGRFSEHAAQIGLWIERENQEVSSWSGNGKHMGLIWKRLWATSCWMHCQSRLNASRQSSPTFGLMGLVSQTKRLSIITWKDKRKDTWELSCNGFCCLF